MGLQFSGSQDARDRLIAQAAQYQVPDSVRRVVEDNSAKTFLSFTDEPKNNNTTVVKEEQTPLESAKTALDKANLNKTNAKANLDQAQQSLSMAKNALKIAETQLKALEKSNNVYKNIFTFLQPSSKSNNYTTLSLNKVNTNTSEGKSLHSEQIGKLSAQVMQYQDAVDTKARECSQAKTNYELACSEQKQKEKEYNSEKDKAAKENAKSTNTNNETTTSNTKSTTSASTKDTAAKTSTEQTSSTAASTTNAASEASTTQTTQTNNSETSTSKENNEQSNTETAENKNEALIKEMEAVKKVINENVEKTFRIFS